MPELSLRNIDQISNDIRNEEISFSHLIDDLIDHVCCDVEFEMQKGIDFVNAYQSVKQKMGSPHRLSEIQKETLYLVDLKYRKMKNTMKFSGIAGTIIFGCAALFKIQHWPLSGILLTIGAILLAFVFMPSALGVLWKETHNRNRLFLFVSGFITAFLFISGTLFKVQHWPAAGYMLVLSAISAVFMLIPALLLNRLGDQENRHKRSVYIFGSAGAIFYILGMLFKIQHWPASSVLMVLGLIMLGYITIPWYTRVTWKDENNVSPAFIFIILGSLLIIVPGALVNINLQSMYDNGYFPHMEQQQRLFEARKTTNNSILTRYQDSLFYPQMKSLDEKTEAVVELIGSIQKKMVEVSEGDHGIPARDPVSIVRKDAGYEINYHKIANPFYLKSAQYFLIPSSQSRQELNAMLDDYSKYIATKAPQHDLEKLRRLLEPSAYLPEEDNPEAKITMMSSFHSLEVLKNNLITVESYLLSEIAAQ